MIVSMVTTSDNPFDYFKDFNEWKAWDERNNYFTLNYLARIARTSPELSPKEYNDEINRAVDEIVAYNLTGNYIKVTSEI